MDVLNVIHILIILDSNIRLLDCINTPEKLVEYAHEIGLKGICITDHEALGSHMEIDRLIKKWKEIDPEFKIGRGNEIYLTETRDKNQKYYHFILLAADTTGHRMLRELSSIASNFKKRIKRNC